MKTRLLPLVILIILGLALAGVGYAAPSNPGVQQSDPMDAIPPEPFASLTAAGPQAGATATPHPILSDVRVRQAIVSLTLCSNTASVVTSGVSTAPARRRSLMTPGTR